MHVYTCPVLALRSSDAAGGAVASTIYIAAFDALGYFNIQTKSMLPVIWLTSLAATIVEGLPIYSHCDDNLTVPVVTAFAGNWLMQSTLPA